MKKVKVYTKYNCPKCDMTKMVLNQIGVDYELINVEDDEKAMDYVKNTLKFSAMPVVEVEGQDAFHDFRPDLLHKLAE